MGDLRPDNGSGRPHEDGAGGLPGVPPEWGTVIIPDDAAELGHEALAIRRELRRRARRARIRRWVGLKPGTLRTGPAPSENTIAIMMVAVLTTLISLVVVTWAPRPDQSPASGLTSTDRTQIADLKLIGAGDNPVKLASLLPAVIFLVDGCSCTPLILDAAATVPPGVAVLIIAGTPPPVANLPGNVHNFADPGGIVRARLANGRTPGPAATALMIDASGNLLGSVSAARTIDDLRSGIARLTSR